MSPRTLPRKAKPSEGVGFPWDGVNAPLIQRPKRAPLKAPMSKITYQLTSKLADGILCSSYQGVAHLPNGTQRDVVLKQIHQHFTQDSVMMSHLTGFADVARGLNHPGLTAVWDLGQHQGYTFFVREFLPGISLRRLFSLVQENQAALSPSMAIYLVQEMADAISAIHRHRVPGDQPIYLFHGGLAPENILLTKIGNVVVSDAGLDVIFWRDSDAAWKLRQRKLPYQPPEYDSGERPMRRGDGYGVAALLYQMIMGTPPPGAGAGGASWVPPSSVHPRVTETFDQILFQCLHPQVEERMVQMKELQKAFRQEGLLTQEAMERRDAMAYLEALVSEAFDPNHGDRHALPIVGSFEMTSLLPSRDDLLPPEQRYRPPVYDHTDAFHPQRPNQPVPDPKDPISIADPLGAPLHESSELAAKTLASAFPQPEEEEDILDGDDMLIPVEDDEDEEGLEAAPRVETEDFALPVEEEAPRSFVEEDLHGGPVRAPEKTEVLDINDVQEVQALREEAQALKQSKSSEVPEIPADSSVQPIALRKAALPPSEGKEAPSTEDFAPAVLSHEDVLAPLEELEKPAIGEKIGEHTMDLPPRPLPHQELSTLSDADEEMLEEVLEEEDLEEVGESTSLEPSLLRPQADKILDDLLDNSMIVEDSLGAELAEDDLITEDPPQPSDVPVDDGPTGQITHEDTHEGPLAAMANGSHKNPLQASSLMTPPGAPETANIATQQVKGIPTHAYNQSFVSGEHQMSMPPQGMPETVALPVEQVLPPHTSTPAMGSPQIHTLHPSSPSLPSAPPPKESLPPGQERFGKFVLLNRVALGGMAEVFRAKFEGPNNFQKLVAIKRILPEYTQDHNFLQMFVDEARIAGSLRHPNIVQIQELGQIDGVFFISMEYIDGIDLARVIKIRRALQQSIPLEIVLDIGIAVCRALEYAHNECDPDGRPLNMIHRDVTPHNILISKKGECKLTDFGIAKASQNIAETAVGELKGKISYMSPEQAEGKPLDVRSDLFQVGIVMYEMLTLKKMFEGNSDQSILSKIQHAQFEPPRRIISGVPKHVEQVVMRALANDPLARYQTSLELRKALTQARAQLKVKTPVDIADFAYEIVEQRDELLAQHAAARRKQVQEHAFSMMGGQPPVVAPPAAVSAPPAAAAAPSIAPEPDADGPPETSGMLWIVFLLMLLGAGGTAGVYFLQKKKPPDTVVLSVYTNPAGADIYLNGKVIGQTPLFGKKLLFSQQLHSLRLEKPGYKPFELSFKFEHPKELKRVPVVLQRTEQRMARPKRVVPKTRKGSNQPPPRGLKTIPPRPMSPMPRPIGRKLPARPFLRTPVPQKK